MSYEGLAWLAGTAVVIGAAPSSGIVLAALLYSLGAHGIMTLNDFKSVEGDRLSGIRSLPVQLGPPAAARAACVMMLLPQAGVVLALAVWHRPWFALGLAAMTATQAALMPRFLANPRREAARYNATGTGLYVLGMMLTAVALRSFGVGA